MSLAKPRLFLGVRTMQLPKKVTNDRDNSKLNNGLNKVSSTKHFPPMLFGSVVMKVSCTVSLTNDNGHCSYSLFLRTNTSMFVMIVYSLDRLEVIYSCTDFPQSLATTSTNTSICTTTSTGKSQTQMSTTLQPTTLHLKSLPHLPIQSLPLSTTNTLSSLQSSQPCHP